MNFFCSVAVSPGVVRSRLEEDALPASLFGLRPPCRQLFVEGSLPAAPFRVAVVGSRSPSPSGEHVAYEIAWGLARAGVVVVSGLARGIDSAAHRGALDAGGLTMAFLGCGFDQLGPRSARELGTRIRERGALVTEYPPDAVPKPYRFVHRNRLIAAITVGTPAVNWGDSPTLDPGGAEMGA